MTDDLETTIGDVRAATEPPGEDDVAFEAPWQARAFALTVALRREDDSPWASFQRPLSDELADDSEGDGETADAAEAVESAYYRAWLSAFERLLLEEDVVGDRGHSHDHPHDHADDH